VQLVLQTFVPQVRCPPHGCAPGITQVPALQAPTPIELLPEQLALPQLTVG
jgi:hypothetical protein